MYGMEESRGDWLWLQLLGLKSPVTIAASIPRQVTRWDCRNTHASRLAPNTLCFVTAIKLIKVCVKLRCRRPVSPAAADAASKTCAAKLRRGKHQTGNGMNASEKMETFLVVECQTFPEKACTLHIQFVTGQNQKWNLATDKELMPQKNVWKSRNRSQKNLIPKKVLKSVPKKVWSQKKYRNWSQEKTLHQKSLRTSFVQIFGSKYQ